MKRAWIILAILLLLLLAGGGGLLVYEKFKSRRDFLKAILPDARHLDDKLGIKAAITLTQAGLESGAGSELALTYKNLFGIKAGSSWKGPVVNLSTTEELNGVKVRVLASDPKTRADYFRVYPTWFDSMLDWSSLLARLYPEAYQAAQTGDIARFARGLKNGRAGAYATDSTYGAQLANLFPTAQEIVSV